jgi:hypothetical protein
LRAMRCCRQLATPTPTPPLVRSTLGRTVECYVVCPDQIQKSLSWHLPTTCWRSAGCCMSSTTIAGWHPHNQQYALQTTHCGPHLRGNTSTGFVIEDTHIHAGWQLYPTAAEGAAAVAAISPGVPPERQRHIPTRP